MRRNLLPFLLGFMAMTGQAVILRAFQTVFYGNELSYAVILSSWLFWVCAGSLAAVRGCRRWQKILSRFPVGMLILMALGVPVVLSGIRMTHPLWGVAPGQMIGIFPMIGAAVIWTAPIAFLSGSAFVILYRIRADQDNAAGATYVWESLGSGVAGIVFTFIFLRLMPMTLVTWTAAAVVVAGLIWACRDQGKILWFLSALFLCLLALLCWDAAVDFDQISQEGNYPQGQLLAVEDSPYANLAVVQTAEDLSFYQNGMLGFTVGDRLSAEENVHFAMLSHPHPRRVLLVGSGLGGEVAEVLKYPGIHLDFVEIDTQLIGLFQRYAPDDKVAELHAPAVSVIVADARQFIRTYRGEGYDVVLMNCGDPYTAGVNRYYTLEFLKELRRVLNPGGIAAFRVSSSENYLSQENRVFLSTLDWTLRAVFPEVRSIPGDRNTFLAAESPGQIRLDPRVFAERLDSPGLKNQFLTAHTIAFYIDPRRIQQVETILRRMPQRLNTDLFPRAYLFRTILWSTHFGPVLGRFMKWPVMPVWGVPAGLGLVCLSVGLWKKLRRRTAGAVDLAVAVTGFSEIIFQVAVILMFQSLYGTAYEFIALIIAAFMTGLVAGARWANCLVSRSSQQDVFRIFLRVQGGVIIYPLILPVVFVIVRDAAVIQPSFGLFRMLFACLPLAAGVLGGLQYPLASVLRQSDSEDRGEAGRLYALDALGAAVGALVTGLILIPSCGIMAVCLLSALFNGAVYVLCVITRRYPARSSAGP